MNEPWPVLVVGGAFYVLVVSVVALPLLVGSWAWYRSGRVGRGVPVGTGFGWAVGAVSMLGLAISIERQNPGGTGMIEVIAVPVVALTTLVGLALGALSETVNRRIVRAGGREAVSWNGPPRSEGSADDHDLDQP